MAEFADVTVKVHFDIDLDGEPITHLMEMPAAVEDMGKDKGLTVHLHLDGRKLATALLPHILREMPRRIRRATDGRGF